MSRLQTMGYLEEPGTFFKKLISLLVFYACLWNTGFYAWSLKTSAIILFVYMWVFFWDVVSLWVSLMWVVLSVIRQHAPKLLLAIAASFLQRL